MSKKCKDKYHLNSKELLHTYVPWKPSGSFSCCYISNVWLYVHVIEEEGASRCDQDDNEWTHDIQPQGQSNAVSATVHVLYIRMCICMYVHTLNNFQLISILWREEEEEEEIKEETLAAVCVHTAAVAPKREQLTIHCENTY